MGVEVRIVDRAVHGRTFTPWTLRLVSERMDARTLIRRRVEHELAARNGDGPDEAVPIPLVRYPVDRPGDTGSPIASSSDRSEHAVADAVAAFEANGFLMLVDDVQVESLDEAFGVTDDTVVTFLRLVPLVGG